MSCCQFCGQPFRFERLGSRHFLLSLPEPHLVQHSDDSCDQIPRAFEVIERVKRLNPLYSTCGLGRSLQPATRRDQYLRRQEIREYLRSLALGLVILFSPVG